MYARVPRRTSTSSPAPPPDDDAAAAPWLPPVPFPPGQGIGVRTAQRDLGHALVGGVVLQDVQDESLLDGLLHGVEVERLVLARLVGGAEEVQGLRLGRGREREVADPVAVVRLGRHADQGVLVRPRFQDAVLVHQRCAVLPQRGGGIVEVEQLLDRAGRVAGLRGVGLVREHRKALALERAALFADLGEGIGEGLQGHADDGHATGQRLDELSGLGTLRAGGDGLELAGRVHQLVHGVLELAVQHLAVRDHEDGVEHLVPGGGVERGHAVGGPRDGVRLAGAGGVLDEVLVPRTLLPRGGGQPGDGAPLVVAREADLRGVRLRARARIHLSLVVHVRELGEDAQPRVPLQGLLPEVGGARAVRVGRVARAVVVAPVERQERRSPALELGGHVDVVVREGEVHERAPEGRQQGLTGGSAVVLVLLDRGLERLGEVGLDLHRGYGQAVEEEHQVDPVRLARGVHDLLDHPEAVLRVALRDAGVAVVRRGHLQHAEPAGAGNHEALAEHVQDASPITLRLGELAGQAVQDTAFALGAGSIVTVGRDDLGVVVRVCFCEPAQDVLGEEGPLLVVTGRGFRVEPPVVPEVLRDLLLELLLLVLLAHGLSLVLPVQTLRDVVFQLLRGGLVPGGDVDLTRDRRCDEGGATLAG